MSGKLRIILMAISVLLIATQFSVAKKVQYKMETVGKHNDEVLGSLLGKSTADIDALRVAGVLISKPY